MNEHSIFRAFIGTEFTAEDSWETGTDTGQPGTIPRIFPGSSNSTT